MHKVSRSLLFASIVALGGLAACGDDVTVEQTTPPAQGSVAVSPSPASVAVGKTVTLVAVANGDAAGQAVTWTSSDPAIAKVDQSSGVVTGVAVGSAAITAKTANGFSGAATVNVVAGSTNQQASVSIASITKGNLNTPVALNNVMGQIDVTLNVDPGQQNVERVELVVIDSVTGTEKVVASQAITSASAAVAGDVAGLSLSIAKANAEAAALLAANVPQQIVLSFNTAAFTLNADTTAATVLHTNGRKQLRARLVLGTGSSQDQVASNSVSVFFNNQDGFYATQKTLSSTSVTGPVTSIQSPWTGTVWYQTGNGIQVKTVPVMYSGRTVASRTVRFNFANTADPSATVSGSGAQTVTLPVGVRADSGRVEVINAVAADGNAISLVQYAGETGIINAQPLGSLNNNENIGVRLDSIRTDNVPPTGTYALASVDSNWVNGVYSFLRAGNFTGVADVAVGLATTAAPYGATVTVSGCGITGVDTVSAGAELGECATDLTNTAYTGRVIIRDRLGNALTTPTFTFGVDTTAPRIQYLASTQFANVVRTNDDSVFHNTIPTYPGVTSNEAQFGVRFTDERSGFNITTGSLKASITRLAPNGINAVTSCVLGSGTGCTPASIVGAVEDPGNPLDLLADPTFRRYTVPIYGNATATSPGYYTFNATLTDRAGNVAQVIGDTTTTTVTKRAAIDITAPQITGVTVPAILTGGQSATFTPTGTDDLEVIYGDLALLYPDLADGTGNGYLRWRGEFFGMYDAPWNNTLATPVGPGATFGANGLTIPGPFITRIEVVENDSTPQQANTPDIATTVGARLRDIKTTSGWADADADTAAWLAGTSTLLTAPIFPAQIVTGGTTFGSREGVLTDDTRVNQFYIMGTTANTVTVRAVGPTISVNPPFTRIEIARYNSVTGAYDVLAGTLSAVTTADQGSNRFYTWTFTLVGTSSPLYGVGMNAQTGLAAGDIIRAIGVDANGNGLATLQWNVGTGVVLNPVVPPVVP